MTWEEGQGGAIASKCEVQSSEGEEEVHTLTFAESVDEKLVAVQSRASHAEQPKSPPELPSNIYAKSETSVPSTTKAVATPCTPLPAPDVGEPVAAALCVPVPADLGVVVDPPPAPARCTVVMVLG